MNNITGRLKMFVAGLVRRAFDPNVKFMIPFAPDDIGR